MSNKDFQNGFIAGAVSGGVVEVDSDYTLPIGGDELGGVKNGGNVVISDDGTMNAPGEEWEHICDISVSADDALSSIYQDLGGSFRKVLIKVSCGGNALTSANTTMRVRVNHINNAAAVTRITDNGTYRDYFIYMEYTGSPLNDIRGYVSWYGWYSSGMTGLIGNGMHHGSPISAINISLDSSTFLSNTYKIYGVRVE